MIDTHPHDYDTTLMGPGFFVFFQRGVIETGGYEPEIYKDHPWFYEPIKPKGKEEKKALKVVEQIIQTQPEDTSEEDLELALRLRLEYQEITFKFIYLVWLQQEHEHCELMRKQEEEAIFLLLLQ